ncbi:MAG: 4-hydroxy-3-methylbut-2-enyl diphosphate reductase [Bacteroidales bacterium]|nr:4-hydroxy-3-methylbut-2-enyl diphosphate reductase [Bacteroidales bacterium]
MSVVIDDNAGFCFGVVKAIAAAEEQLSSSNSLYCLGDIVHNNAEVQRLSQMGLHVIDHDAMDKLPGKTVLIRAHGEPPSTYQLAERRGIKLIDATCPIVLALQKKVRDGYEEMQSVGGQVVIFGKKGHAEVIGLNGQANNSAIIVSTPDDIESIDFSRPIRLYSQTTKSREDYSKLIENIKASIARQSDGSTVGADFFVAYNTICSRVANRATQLEEFAKGVDVVIFVSGANSSNGHYLYEYCRNVQQNTYMISSPDELVKEWINGKEKIGITGATSTPRWLMEEVRRRIEN